MTRAEIVVAIVATVIVGAIFLIVAYLPQVLLVAARHPIAARLVTGLLPMVSIITVGIAAIFRGLRHHNQ